MDEENNDGMRSGNLDQGLETGKSVAQGAANKVTDAVRNQNEKRKRIRRAKAQVGDKPGKWVSPVKKAKGKVYEAKGKVKTSLGTGLTAAGIGAEAAGLGTRALAQGIRGAGTLASAIPYAGPAIKSALDGVAKTVDTAGKNIKKFGKKVRKQGIENVKSGAHDIKRGNQLANTGKDIGPRSGAAKGLRGIPNAPAQPNIPSIPSIINKAKRKAKLNPLNGGNPFNPAGMSKKKKIIIIAAIAIIIIIIFIVILSLLSETDRAAYIEGDLSNVPYVVSSQIMDKLIIVEDGNGGYKYAFQDEEGNTIEFDEAVENAIQTLKDNGSNALDDLGKNDEERKETLKTLIQAEMMTQYPILSSVVSTNQTGSGTDSNQSTGIITTTPTGEYTVYDYAAWLTHASYNGWGGYLAHHGYASKKETSTSYISDDGKYYYVETVQGILNIGPGIKIDDNADRFAEYGIDINDLKAGDPVDGDIVEAVSSQEFLDDIAAAKKQAEKRGITLTDNQAQALGSVKYSVGNLNQFWSLYDQYGSLEEAAEHFNKASGCSPESFYPVDKDITSEELAELKKSEGTKAAKSASRYLMFKYGIYRSYARDFDQAVQDIISGNVVIGKGATADAIDSDGNIIKQVSSDDSADMELFIQIADQIYQNISAHKLLYGQGANNPTSYITDSPSKNIDCSSYVSSVLYEFDSEKYSRFAHQQATGTWYPKVEEWAEEYGWTVFYIDDNTTIDDFQPGDIIIGDASTIGHDMGHVQIFVSAIDSSDPKSGAYVLDCGGHQTWLNSSDYHDIPTYYQKFWQVSTNGVGLKVIRLNDSGGSYTYVDNGDLQGGIKVQRKSSNGTTKLLRYIDEESFNQMVISGSDNCMNYFTLKKASSSTTSSSSQSIGGTDILNDWVASWEDSSLFLYKKGLGSYNSAVAKQMTEDGKYYICTDDSTDNGTLNYGFGVCVYNPSESGWMQVENFAKYGIDITQSVIYQTQIEVDIVDQVQAIELQSHYDYITGKLNAAGVELNEDQINALCGIAYQFGDSGANIDSFIELYKKYGNTEELRQNYYSSSGKYQLFVHIRGGTNSEGIDRAAANWALFHDGIYYAGSGGTLDKNQYGFSTVDSSNNNQNVQLNDANFTGSSNAEIAWNFFKSMGLSDVSTAAIVGNLMLESGGNTKNISPTADNGSHRGIAQWDYSNRYANLRKYAASINGDPDDLKVQLQFLWLELSPTADHTYANARFDENKYNTFISYNSVSEATEYFAAKFEGCTGALSSRQKNAESIYSELSGTGTPTSSSISSLNNFLFIGDSRYEGNTYISQLGDNIKNAGVVSANIKEWTTVVENGGKGTVQGKSVDISGTYSGISVQLGANGIYNNVGNTESQMKTLIEKLKVLYPNTPIFINSCLQVSPKGNSAGYSWDAATYRDNIEEFNNDMANYCNQVDNVYYIDISDSLYDSDGYLKDEYTGDGVHCNNEGQKIFADNIKNAILNSKASSNYQSENETSTAGNTGSNYVLVVANKKSTTTTVVESYSYDHTTVTETSNGYNYSGSQSTETPSSSTVSSNVIKNYSSVTIDFQTALKPNTLYFDFTWAILVNSGNRKFTLNWADLALKSSVDLTIYNDESTTSSMSSQGSGVISKTTYNGGSKSIVDYYNKTTTTTTTTTTVTSKAAITKADTWILNYENNPNTYAEYQAKGQEQISEKVDPDDTGDNIIKLLRSNKDLLKQLTKGKYRVDRALEDNEKVKFMSDVYEYILNIANNNKVEENTVKLENLLSTNLFDLSNTSTTTKKVLTYSGLNISDSDKELLYKFVEQVGENCSKEEKEYLASVILNRALSGKFGSDNVTTIINLPYQYENYDSTNIASVIASDDSKSAVDTVIASGDTSQYAIYYATPATAQQKGWGTNLDADNKKKTVSGDTYEFYTTDDAVNELQKYEVSVVVSAGTAGTASDLAQQMVAWAEQWVGKSTFYSKAKGNSQSNGYCARFVMSAYDEVGLGYYGANCARDLPHPNEMKYNSDGTVDWSEIPVGAIIVSNGTSAYGHVCLYIGNGYVIEAGGPIVKKSTIDESFGGKGHNCAPFLGWGFAAKDQEATRALLETVSQTDVTGGNYETGWTDMTSTMGKYSSSTGTGIEGVFKSGDKTFKVFSQCSGPWGLQTLNEPSKTFCEAGCGVTSVSILLTGLGYDITPIVFKDTHSAGDQYVKQHLEEYNVNYKRLSSMSEIVEELKKGNPVIYHVNNGTVGNEYYTGHYVTLLAVDDSGRIFLGDPYTRSGCNSGWYTQDKFTGMTSAYSVWK